MQPIRVITTTINVGSWFDFFQFVAWKSNATLSELYVGLGNMEALEWVYRLRVGRGIDEAENTLKAEFYLALQMDIITEIALRLMPMSFYSPN
jgi:hypothetical protein